MMGEAGILGEDDRVELIDGEMAEMAPLGSRHVGVVNALTGVLADPRVGRDAEQQYTLSVQNPLIVGPHQETPPDLTLLRAGRGTAELPKAAGALLVVEVADTSLAYDRERKLPLYAAAGIPEAWLVNLARDRVDVHSSPESGGSGYGTLTHYVRGEKVVSATLPGLTFDAAEALPPRRT